MGLEDAKTEIDHAFTRQNLKGPSFELTFAGATSFLRRRYTKDLKNVDIAVTGIPFDQAVTNRPRHQIRAPVQFVKHPPYKLLIHLTGGPFDVISERVIVDYGDVAFDYANITEFPDIVTNHIREILAAGAASVVLGGDHYISYPILKAYAEIFGPLSIIQVDAHTDTWPDDDMARVDHGTMFYKAVKSGIVNPATSIQIGIRTTNIDTLGVNIIDAAEFHRIGPKAVADRVRQVVGDRPCYLTFDIDGLDPAYAPGTGTPVWGGLTSAQAAALLRGLAGINIRGGDIVEVSPPFDTSGATAIAGAHIATEICCLLGWRMRGR